MRCCKDCKWYFCNKDIVDEIGKHECFGHYLICSPLLLVESVEHKNACPSFEERSRIMTRDEIRIKWMTTDTYVNDDKYNALIDSIFIKLINKP